MPSAMSPGAATSALPATFPTDLVSTWLRYAAVDITF
jgi:hypothetical protein